MCADSCLSCWLCGLDCDGTLRSTRVWVLSRGADPNSVVSYVRDSGGCCDCEVLWNVFDGRRLVLDDLVLCCGAT